VKSAYHLHIPSRLGLLTKKDRLGSGNLGIHARLKLVL
jgi:hypothetical protein